MQLICSMLIKITKFHCHSIIANTCSLPNKQLEVIGIDEAQFFDDLYDFCCKAADHDGKTLIIAGLDGDYLR